MSDILTRLRAAEDDATLAIGQAWNLIENAADEIERLREEVNGQRDGEAQEIVTLRNQRDEARALLRECHDFVIQVVNATGTGHYAQALALLARLDAFLAGGGQ